MSWPTDPFVTTPNVIDDHINQLRGDRFTHRRREPLESSMLVSRWVRGVVEWKGVGRGFRCGGHHLFLSGVRSLEHLKFGDCG